MRLPDTYPIAPQIRQMAQALDISAPRALIRAGFAPDHFDHDGRGVTAAQVFALWQAALDESARPGLPLFLGRLFAHGPFAPAICGFSSSPNIEAGLSRLALFKPLIAPVRITLKRHHDSLTIRWDSIAADAPMPASFGLFELVYFLECCRTFTATPIVPLSVGVPPGAGLTTETAAFFSVAPTPAPVATLRLTLADATRRMVFENAELWAELEQSFLRLRENLPARPRTHDRVRRALVDILPSGVASADAVARRLCLSRRSLQRRLQDEGHSFQSVLDATRTELSLHYLRRDDLSVAEIAYLLAYRDANSFYRAFQGWTGMTPAQARARALASAPA